MPNQNLIEIKERIEKGERPRVSVRHLLAWFDAQRRGFYIVQSIRMQLKSLGLETVPDFNYAYIDQLVEFQKIQPKEKEVKPEAEPEIAVVDQHGELVAGAIDDITYRIGKLGAANKSPTTVTPNDSLNRAVTIMLQRDFSQLPVMTGPRDVKGIVTWKTIGRHLVLKGAATEVREVMEDARTVSNDASLFEALPFIAGFGYVLVHGKDDVILGIVTTSDLADQFRELSEPFLLLGEIENHIRKMLDGKFSKEELEKTLDPKDNEREIGTIADLAFGEYIRVFEKPECWDKCGLPVDKKAFVDDLHRVRNIRNDVMHFDPDPLADSDISFLQKTARFLRDLKGMELY